MTMKTSKDLRRPCHRPSPPPRPLRGPAAPSAPDHQLGGCFCPNTFGSVSTGVRHRHCSTPAARGPDSYLCSHTGTFPTQLGEDVSCSPSPPAYGPWRTCAGVLQGCRERWRERLEWEETQKKVKRHLNLDGMGKGKPAPCANPLLADPLCSRCCGRWRETPADGIHY